MAFRTGQYDRQLEEQTLSSEETYAGIFLRVQRDRAKAPDGSEVGREYVRHPGAVVIVAERTDGRLLIEHQYRYPLKRVFVEFPAGKIDPGEAIEACAIRELAEERMTMLVVTHEMAFAREVASRVVFMDGGEIVEARPARELFAAPEHPRTRAFLENML